MDRFNQSWRRRVQLYRFPIASSEIWERGSFSTGVETQEIAFDRVCNWTWVTAIVG